MKATTMKQAWDWSMWFLLAVFLALGIGAVFGCAGEALEQEEDVGQVAQGVFTRTGYGWRTDVAIPLEGMACQAPANASASQACIFPSKKSVEVKIGHTCDQFSDVPGFVNELVGRLNSQLGAGALGFGSWLFTVFPFDDGEIEHPLDDALMTFTCSTSSVSGQDKLTNINRYADSNCFAGLSAAQTEPPGGFPGTYRTCQHMTTTLNWGAINTNFTNSTQRARVKRHAVGFGGSRAAGLGGQITDANRYTSPDITVNADKSSSLLASEVCAAKQYNPGGSSITISNATSCN